MQSDNQLREAARLEVAVGARGVVVVVWLRVFVRCRACRL